MAIEDQIAPLDEVFRLQGADELAQAERTYSPAPGRGVQAVLLAASRGRELESLTVDRPKSMIQIGGKPILARLVEECKRQGIHNIRVVAGYRSETVKLEEVEVVVNEKHETTGEIASLRLALPREGQALIIYGDLLMRSSVLRDVLEYSGEAVAVVDSLTTTGPDSDFAVCDVSDDRSYFGPAVRLHSMVTSEVENHGRWIGVLRLGGAALERAHQILEQLQDGSMSDLLNALLQDGQEVQVHYIHGHWLDVNRLEDIERADAFSRT